jgi:hypothetical protein
MKKIVLLSGVVIAIAALLIILNYQRRMQPTVVVEQPFVEASLFEIPPRNKQVIAFIESDGSRIAPSYQEAVCTEFVIAVIGEFYTLTKQEKQAIRIITDDPVEELIEQDAPIVKGVQTALISGRKGKLITDLTQILPGDFVQFWNIPFGLSANGHCGIVKEIEPRESITLYSSHPVTNGYGIHKFSWPDKAYFVRLN